MRSRSIPVLIAILALASASCKRDPQKLKLEYVASGDRNMTERKYSEAVIQYRNAVTQDGHFGEARYKLANAYLLAGDMRNALGEFVRAADLMPGNVEAQIQAGKLLLFAGSYPEAKARALMALEKDSKNVDALSLMGNALAGMKDLDGAITQIEQAIDTDPQRTLTYANLGALEQARGNAPAALAAFKRAAEIAPKSAATHLSLANYYWASNQSADAEREFKIALELAPQSTSANQALALFYFKANRPAEGEEYLKAYAKLSTEVGPKLVLADYYIEAKRPQEAVGLLEGLQTTKDGFIPAKLRLAAIDFAANRRPQAYKGLDEVFAREPKNEEALIEKVRFLMAENKATDALPLTNTVVTGNPKSVAGQYVRGTVLAATGAPDEAIKAFQQVLQLRPSAVPAQVQLGSLFLARGDATAALQFLDQAVKSQPASGVIHFLIAESLVRLGKVARAETEVMMVAKANPASADVHRLVGDLYYLKRDMPRAREAYARALQTPPGPIAALAGLTKVDLAENKRDAARARIESRLATTPDDVELLRLSGATFVGMNDATRAESVYRHLLQVDSSSLDAYRGLGNLYLSQNRLDEAKKEFEDVARKQPKTAAGASTMVGTILTLQGKPVEARKQFEQALAIDPQAAVAANNLAWNYAEGEDANLDVALQLAQTAKARLPLAWEVDDTLGWIYYKKGLATLAITALRQGTGRNPTNPTLHYHLGLAYLKNGEKGEAAKSLQRALKLNPQFEAAEDAKRQLASIKG
jgi:tetratricopeptide (TPR) repeat protein